MRLFRESAHLPTLIAGDFNDWLNTLARGPFASHGFVQVTAPRHAVPLIPGVLAGRFARQDVCARSVRDSPRADRAHEAGSRGLDHLPVVDFHLDCSPIDSAFQRFDLLHSSSEDA